DVRACAAGAELGHPEPPGQRLRLDAQPLAAPTQPVRIVNADALAIGDDAVGKDEVVHVRVDLPQTAGQRTGEGQQSASVARIEAVRKADLCPDAFRPEPP